jgi:hypothetical protein
VDIEGTRSWDTTIEVSILDVTPQSTDFRGQLTLSEVEFAIQPDAAKELSV